MVAVALGQLALAQRVDASEEQPGIIVGTVVAIDSAVLSGATVVLRGPTPGDSHSVLTNDDGFYEFHGVEPGTAYRVIVRAAGFGDWTSPVIVLESGQYKILPGSKLQFEEVKTTVDVNYSPVEVATEQVEVELKQRVFGFIPNFYTVYDPNPEPLRRS